MIFNLPRVLIFRYTPDVLMILEEFRVKSVIAHIRANKHVELNELNNES